MDNKNEWETPFSDVRQNTPLYLAIRHGKFEIAQRLVLEQGVDVNAKNYVRCTALMAACEIGNQVTMQLPLENGADINLCGYYGTALTAASSAGHYKIVQILLENGADVNAHSGFYKTALNTACSKGYKEIVRLLLDNGADVNVQTESCSALEEASWGGYKEIVQLLLDKGADVNARGGRFGSALEAARDTYNGEKKIMKLLLGHGPNPEAMAEERSEADFDLVRGFCPGGGGPEGML